jgi:hypothetical protein
MKRIMRIVLIALSISLVPLLAMQFSDEVKWDLADFVVVGALLIGTGLVYELVATRMRKPEHRVVLGIALAAALLLLWIELAVGIFGTPLSGS